MKYLNVVLKIYLSQLLLTLAIIIPQAAYAELYRCSVIDKVQEKIENARDLAHRGIPQYQGRPVPIGDVTFYYDPVAKEFEVTKFLGYSGMGWASYYDAKSLQTCRGPVNLDANGRFQAFCTFTSDKRSPFGSYSWNLDFQFQNGNVTSLEAQLGQMAFKANNGDAPPDPVAYYASREVIGLMTGNCGLSNEPLFYKIFKNYHNETSRTARSAMNDVSKQCNDYLDPYLPRAYKMTGEKTRCASVNEQDWENKFCQEVISPFYKPEKKVWVCESKVLTD